jgi:hypothetical protein
MLYPPYQSRSIKVDPDAISSRSLEVKRRIDRIADHFKTLDEMLTKVENQLLKNDKIAEFEQRIGENLDNKFIKPR